MPHNLTIVSSRARFPLSDVRSASSSRAIRARSRATKSRHAVRSRATSPAAPRRLSSSRSTIVHPRTVRAPKHAAQFDHRILTCTLPIVRCQVSWQSGAAFGLGLPPVDVTSRYQTWRCPAAIGGNDLSRRVGRDTSAAPQPHFDVAAGADSVPRVTADADVATLQRRLWSVQPADAEGRPPNTAFDSLKIRADLRGDLVRQLTLSPIPPAAHSRGSVVTVAAPRGAWVRRDHGTDMVRIEVPAGSPLKAKNRPAATLGTRPRVRLGPHSMQA